NKFSARGIEMKGHIREGSPGHWAIVIDVRDPATGKRKRKWHSFIGTKRQAQVECAKLIAEIKNGTALDPVLGGLWAKVLADHPGWGPERWSVYYAFPQAARILACY